MQMHAYTSVALSQNKNEQLYKTGSALGDAYFGKHQWSLKDTITAMSSSLWSTLKQIGINLVPIRPSNPLLHPSTIIP